MKRRKPAKKQYKEMSLAMNGLLYAVAQVTYDILLRRAMANLKQKKREKVS